MIDPKSLRIVTENFAFPLEYIPDGQIILDANGNQCIDIRGWGRLSNQFKHDHNKAMEIQDTFGKWVTETLNKAVLTPTEPDTKELTGEMKDEGNYTVVSNGIVNGDYKDNG